MCTKSFVGCGFAPDPTRGSLQRSARPPIAIFRGPTFKGRGQDGKGEEGRERRRGSSSFDLGRKKKNRRI